MVKAVDRESRLREPAQVQPAVETSASSETAKSTAASAQATSPHDTYERVRRGRADSTRDGERAERPPRRERETISDLSTWENEFAKIDLQDHFRDLDFERNVDAFEAKFEDQIEENVRERRLKERKKAEVRRVEVPRPKIPTVTLSPTHHVAVPRVGQAVPNLPVAPSLPPTSPLLFPLWHGESLDDLRSRHRAHEAHAYHAYTDVNGYAKKVEDLSLEEKARLRRMEDARRLEKIDSAEDFIDDVGDARRDFRAGADESAQRRREELRFAERRAEEQRLAERRQLELLAERNKQGSHDPRAEADAQERARERRRYEIDSAEAFHQDALQQQLQQEALQQQLYQEQMAQERMLQERLMQERAAQERMDRDRAERIREDERRYSNRDD